MNHVRRIPVTRLIMLAALVLAGVALFLLLSPNAPQLADPGAVQTAP